MALQFQAPNIPGLQRTNTVPQSIDDIFNTYQQAKMQQQQMAMGQQQLAQAQQAQQAGQAQFGLANGGFTPQQISQGMAGAQQPLPQGPLPNGQNLGQQAEQLHPVEAYIRQRLALERRGQQIGQEHTAAETDLLTARKNEIEKGGGGNHYSIDQAASLLAPSPSDLEKTKQSLKKLYPNGYVPKDYTHIGATNNRLNATIGEKQSQFDAKRLTSLGDALDPSKQRAGAFGVSKQVFDRAERLQSLAGSFKDNNLDSRQIEELAVGLNAMLSGSNTGAQSQVAALVPKSIVGDAQKLREWLVNDPQGTNQQDFVSRMLGSVAREKATAEDQIKRTQYSRIGRYADLEKSNPDGFYNTLQSVGIDPEEYKKWRKEGSKPMSAVQGAEGGKAAHSDLLDKYGTP